jgi:hypothetical protein
MRGRRLWGFSAISVGICLAVAGCGNTEGLPFQQRGAGLAAYGYSEVKRDALHYSVSYSDNNAKSAENFLELRAAQIAQAAGYRYFTFDNRGSNVVRRTESDINYNDVARQGMPAGGSGARHTMDMVPQSVPVAVTRYYYAWGQVALLTDDEARGNARALQVSEVLARPGATLAP